jgi:hypothetical protein
MGDCSQPRSKVHVPSHLVPRSNPSNKSIGSDIALHFSLVQKVHFVHARNVMGRQNLGSLDSFRVVGDEFCLPFVQLIPSRMTRFENVDEWLDRNAMIPVVTQCGLRQRSIFLIYIASRHTIQDKGQSRLQARTGSGVGSIR